MIDEQQAQLGLGDGEYRRVQAMIRAMAGIALPDGKRAMVVSRLSRLMRSHGFSSFSAYLDLIERAAGPGDRQDFVNALTTNLTRFFREEHHFELLGAHVEEVLASPRGPSRPQRRLRIWSAGCSSGQEPYSIALMLMGRFPALRQWDFRILATDIDTDVLEVGRAGIYTAGELEGLTDAQCALFERLGDGRMRVPADIRSLVAFRHLNLNDEWPMSGPFDAIFCRNVAIYFDRPTQRRLFSRLGGMLAEHGVLCLGHSEHTGAECGLVSVGPTTYRRARAAGAQSA